MSDPLTQPLESQEEEASQEVWGQLYPHCANLPRIPLTGEKFKIGRREGDYIIQMSDLGDMRVFSAISKTQCEIVRTEEGVFLKDCSSNGTWVNGHKVGKNSSWPLVNNAEICFVSPSRKMFVFIMSEPEETFPPELTSRYILGKVLGDGGAGEVRLGFRLPDLDRVAVKIIRKTGSTFGRRARQQHLRNEVKILQAVNHPNIIKLEDVVDCENFLFIVLELAEGGELFEKMTRKVRLDEASSKLIFYQLSSAIDYLHSTNICHRDLKPENVLLSTEDDNNPLVKITDMGLSKLVDETILKTFCGTEQYMAPEMWKSQGRHEVYTLKVIGWTFF